MANEAVLAEYKAVRSEIEQLNGQIFATLGSSLALNLTILGWFFEKTPSSYALPTVGIALLFFGNVILLNRNRLAHRLAFFQKYFIEPRIPDICWGRIYFEYRSEYQKQGAKITASFAERLAESGTWILISASTMNIIVLAYFGLKLLILNGRLDPWQVLNFVAALAVLGSQYFFTLVMTNYDPIEQTMQDLAKRAQIAIE